MTNHSFYRFLLAIVAVFILVSINYLIILLPISTAASAIIVAAFDAGFCYAAVVGFRENKTGG